MAGTEEAVGTDMDKKKIIREAGMSGEPSFWVPRKKSVILGGP